MFLNVMVLESDPGASAEVECELTDAGHVVFRSHDAGASAFPCRGLVQQSECPVRSHAVDVALTVRSNHRSEPTTHEDGVARALMHRLPLVVAGTMRQPRMPGKALFGQHEVPSNDKVA
jgi:hypothetical protein